MTNTTAQVKVSEKVLAMYGEDYIVVGARFMSEKEFPTVELTTAGGDNYYLQPLKCDRMRIFGSIDGDDYGSSEVVAVDSIVVSERFMVKKEFPTVELTTVNGDNYYLQPFRGYKMRIFGSIDGDGDYGSSDVVGLGNVMNLSTDSDVSESNYSIYSSWWGRDTAALRKEFFRLLVNQAFTNIGSTSRQWYVAMNKYEFNKVIDEFIAASMRYITDAMQ